MQAYFKAYLDLLKVYISFQQTKHWKQAGKKASPGRLAWRHWALYLMQEWHWTGLEQQPGPLGGSRRCEHAKAILRTLFRHAQQDGEPLNIIGVYVKLLQEKIQNPTHVRVECHFKSTQGIKDVKQNLCLILDPKTQTRFMDFCVEDYIWWKYILGLIWTDEYLLIGLENRKLLV